MVDFLEELDIQILKEALAFELKTAEPGETTTDGYSSLRRVVCLGTPGMNGGGGTTAVTPISGKRTL